MSMPNIENHMNLDAPGEREAELRGELIAQRQGEIEKDLASDYDDALVDFIEDNPDAVYEMVHNYLAAVTPLNEEHLNHQRSFFGDYLEQIAAEQARSEFE